MKAYKCDICGKLFEDKSFPTLPACLRELVIAVNGTTVSADICPDCLEEIRDMTRILSPTEENNEPETSSSECQDILE